MIEIKKLTSRQEEYLLLFAERDGQDKCITTVAEQLHVSKPSVFNCSEALIGHGMIDKKAGGEITLTRRGWSYISAKLTSAKELSGLMESELGMDASLADQEARHMVVSLKEETVMQIMKQLKLYETVPCCVKGGHVCPETYGCPYKTGLDDQKA